MHSFIKCTTMHDADDCTRKPCYQLPHLQPSVRSLNRNLVLRVIDEMISLLACRWSAGECYSRAQWERRVCQNSTATAAIKSPERMEAQSPSTRTYGKQACFLAIWHMGEQNDMGGICIGVNRCMYHSYLQSYKHLKALQMYIHFAEGYQLIDWMSYVEYFFRFCNTYLLYCLLV